MKERDPIAGAAWGRFVALFGALALGMFCNASRAADCTIKVGVVLELTGPAGDYGQAAAKAVEMAFRDLNSAGGVRGCRIVTDTKDSQSQSTVAVDAANQLVQLEKVPVIIGGVLSSVTIPMLTAVTGPAKVLQISPGASSPKLTALGREGKTNGMFFRTITSDALQGSVAAKYALERGMHRMAVIYVNSDYGVDLYDEFARTYRALGGVVVAAIRYNEKQSSYASEVTAAMHSAADGLYLISTPVDGSSIARAWISLGGPRRFLLNDGMNSADFIQGVGAKYLNEAYGTSSGTSPTASTASFAQEYKDFARLDPGSPAADRAYDAAAIVGLAIAAATRLDPAAIRAALFSVTDPKGTPIHIGKDEFAKALALIRSGKPIRYEGVIGPVAFDPYGDITGPFRLWRISDGVVTTVGEMSVDQVHALQSAVGR
jgi:branched-chain amino acid transport system substrate-binding protein